MNTEQSRQMTELYLDMYEKMMRVARKNEDSEALAEEAVQEAFCVACKKPEDCLGSPNPQGWLIKTLVKVISNAKKKRANSKRLIEQYLLVRYREAAVSEDHLDLNILYGKAAESDAFQLLIEMAVEGKSHAEMAASRGISVSACKKRVQRAREDLKINLKDDVTK